MFDVRGRYVGPSEIANMHKTIKSQLERIKLLESVLVAHGAIPADVKLETLRELAALLKPSVGSKSRYGFKGLPGVGGKSRYGKK